MHQFFPQLVPNRLVVSFTVYCASFVTQIKNLHSSLRHPFLTAWYPHGHLHTELAHMNTPGHSRSETHFCPLRTTRRHDAPTGYSPPPQMRIQVGNLALSFRRNPFRHTQSLDFRSHSMVVPKSHCSSELQGSLRKAFSTHLPLTRMLYGSRQGRGQQRVLDEPALVI